MPFLEEAARPASVRGDDCAFAMLAAMRRKHSPAAVGSLMDQVQQGMLTGNLAADAARNGGNGTRPKRPSSEEAPAATPGGRRS